MLQIKYLIFIPSQGSPLRFKHCSVLIFQMILCSCSHCLQGHLHAQTFHNKKVIPLTSPDTHIPSKTIMSIKMIILSYSVVTSHACTSLWCFFIFTVRIPSCTAFSCLVRCPFEVAQYSHCSQGYLHVQLSSLYKSSQSACVITSCFLLNNSKMSFNHKNRTD